MKRPEPPLPEPDYVTRGAPLPKPSPTQVFMRRGSSDGTFEAPTNFDIKSRRWFYRDVARFKLFSREWLFEVRWRHV